MDDDTKLALGLGVLCALLIAGGMWLTFRKEQPEELGVGAQR